ncbi:MAG: sporulation protein YunB [Defluviitaleaceae bacterium]|nr:sporulation protein YunB [Defluviitaleaceae bacterium]
MRNRYLFSPIRRRPRPSRPPIKKWKRIMLGLTIGIIALAALTFYLADRNMVPTVVAIANQRAVGLINYIISDSLHAVIDAHNLTTEDFYHKTLDANGRISSLSVNTILVNQIAAILAVDLSDGIGYGGGMRIDVPIGLFSGIPLFAGLGPPYRLAVLPLGEVRVEYETSFSGAGINQINFQVWLNIEAQMRVVIPMQDVIVSVDRRVPLVNSFFAGEVPPGMLPILNTTQ